MPLQYYSQNEIFPFKILFSLISIEKYAHIFSISALMCFFQLSFWKKFIIFSTVLEDLEPNKILLMWYIYERERCL